MNKAVIVINSHNKCIYWLFYWTDEHEMSRYYKSQYKDTLDAYKQYVAATENLLSEYQFYDNFDQYYNEPDEMKRRKSVAYNKYCEAFNKISKFSSFNQKPSFNQKHGNRKQKKDV